MSQIGRRSISPVQLVSWFAGSGSLEYQHVYQLLGFSMKFHFRKRESVQEGVRRIAVEELTAAIKDVRLRQPSPHEAVHELRKRCKKLRGLLRLVRPQLIGDIYAGENAGFRDLARQFSFVRDAHAHLEALARLVAHYPDEMQLDDVQQVHAALVSARQQVAGSEVDLAARLEAAVVPLEQAIERAGQWTIRGDGFNAVAPGLIRTYRRARRAMDLAYLHPSTHHFHEWRKRVKYHWHHVLLLHPTCPKLLKPHAALADQLGELLGQDHDYAVLRERIADLQGDAGVKREKTQLISLIDRRQAELRAQMARRGRVLQAERPRQLAARWRVYWDSSRQC